MRDQNNGINGNDIDADEVVRETEDASLQDDSYSFDEENTDSEEYHDSNDESEGELDFEDFDNVDAEDADAENLKH